MNKIFLWFVKLFNPVWKMLGVEQKQFYAILNAKLKIDGRRKTNMFGGASMGKGYAMQGFIFVILFIVGALCLFFFKILPHTPTALCVYFTLWIVMLTMSIVTDYSDILVSTKDNYTILPTPVNGVTLSTVRIVRILILLFKQSFAFILPALIYWAVYNKSGLLLFIFLTFLSIIMSLCIVVFFYFTAMKYSSPQRFKSIINYLQIGITIFIFAGYHLSSNLFDESAFLDINVFESPYSYLAPTAWLGAIWEMIFAGNYSQKIIIHVVLAIFGTGAAFVYVTKYLSYGYSQRLLSIGQAAGSTETKEKVEVKTAQPRSWLDRLAGLVTYSNVEKAIFKFCFRYTSRNRTFKLKMYPMLGYAPISIAGIFINGKGDFAERLATIQEGSHYFFVVYGAVFFGAMPLIYSQYGDKPEQLWIFRATPLAHPKEVLKAIFKVIFVKFSIPFWLLFFCFSLFIWGPKIIDEFLLGAFILVFLNLLQLRMVFDSLPFSRPWSDMQGGEVMAAFFGFSILTGVIAALHWWFRDYPVILIGGAICLLIATFFIWRSLDSMTWDKMGAPEQGV